MSRSVTVISMGPGDPNLLTLQCAELLRTASPLILRTARHPVADWLTQQGIAWQDYDALYDKYDDFDELHAAMARRLWKRAAEAPVYFAVPDGGNDGAVDALRAGCPEDGVLTVLPGVSRMDSCLAEAPLGAAGGIRVIPATSLAYASLQPALPLLVTELNDAQLAGDVKLLLTELYDDELPVTFFPSSVDGEKTPVTIPLYELDRQVQWDHTVSLLLPPSGAMDRSRFCFDDLLWIMDRLLAPDGCPWDREQTHESLRRYLVEEAWEAVSAVDEQDSMHLADELGDVLLQIVFHAAIGRSHGTFSIGDVTTAICEKMIHRHPHVFGSDQGIDGEKWDQLKRQERGLDTLTDLLEDIPRGIPSAMRLLKVLKRCDAAVRYQPTRDELLADLKAHASQPEQPAEEAVASLFTTLLRLCRVEGVDPELLLGQTAARLIDRYEDAEKRIKSDGKVLQDLTTAELDVYLHGALPAPSVATERAND